MNTTITPEVVVSLSSVSRRLRVGKRKVVESVALGRITPDFRSETGLILFRATRLGELARKLHSKIQF